MFRLAVALSLSLISTMSYPQVHCNTYSGGYIQCSGPDNYNASINSYSGGSSQVTDNRGNTVSVHRYDGGGVGVYSGSTGVVPIEPQSQRSIDAARGHYFPFRR